VPSKARPASAPLCYDGTLRIGIHTSIAGSLERAALKAAELGANTFQIFSASPRMWRARRPDPDQVRKLKQAREKFDLRPLVIHDNYLINLAAEDNALRARSVAAFRAELERALEIGAEFVVAHPGSCGLQDPERGILAVAASLAEAARGLRLQGLAILIENTAGGGTKLGGSFEELEAMRDAAQPSVNAEIGFCLDTAHSLASGYDIVSSPGLLARPHVKLIHANDSKAPLGSHLDRHQHIGRGFIGREGFRRILALPRLRATPFILETPIDRKGDDRRNLETFKRLCQRRPTTTPKSN
jgi:deoxyribonuclease-4